jgi:hypothetical protein
MFSVDATCIEPPARPPDLRCLWGGICASPETPVATPRGDRPISSLRAGDLVFSVHRNALVAVPLARVQRTRVAQHHVVRLRLATGATLEISAPHPLAGGRSFGDLREGEVVDGVTVVGREIVPYPHAATYDILPASDTGTYVSAGILLGSTLR